MSGDVAVRVEGLSKSFGRVQALRDVTFDVPRRSVFGLLGPNGAGKTTLFSIASNFLFADAGNVAVLGVDVRRISRLQGRMTILPQDARFQRSVPILDQLVFLRRLDGRPRAAATAEVERTLERVGLGKYRKRGVHALSHGMVKRLGLAQAFLGEPEVILLDEPTSGLDPSNARQIRDLVREFHERDTTVVISSHNLAEIQELCDHVAILDEGRLVAHGSVAEVTHGSRQVRLRLARAPSTDEVARLAGVPGVAAFAPQGQDRWVATLDPSAAGPDAGRDATVAALLRALLDAGIVPRELREGDSIEDVFLEVTGREEEPGAAGTP